MQATFQTRANLTELQAGAFDSWGALHGRIERRLFAAYCGGDRSTKSIDSLKSATCVRHGITARQFNAISALLKGKIASKVEVDKLALADVKSNIKHVTASLKRLAKKRGELGARQGKAWAGKTLRLARLKRREKALSSGHVSLCFGSRKLFREQFNLKANKFDGPSSIRVEPNIDNRRS